MSRTRRAYLARLTFRPQIALVKKVDTELGAEGNNVFAARETAEQLLAGVLLARLDRNVLVVSGQLRKEVETDANRPDRGQLHWDVQSMKNLLALADGLVPDSARGRALNFMDNLATGCRIGYSTPLSVVAKLNASRCMRSGQCCWR